MDPSTLLSRPKTATNRLGWMGVAALASLLLVAACDTTAPTPEPTPTPWPTATPAPSPVPELTDDELLERAMTAVEALNQAGGLAFSVDSQIGSDISGMAGDSEFHQVADINTAEQGTFLLFGDQPNVEVSRTMDVSYANPVAGSQEEHRWRHDLRHSDLFHLIGVLSPSFGYDPTLIEAWQEAGRLPVKIFVGVGAIGDAVDDARQWRDLLEAKGYDLQYVEANAGHSYGNWRALLDDLLIYFFGKS